MSADMRKKTKKNVMAWMEPEEIALLRKTAGMLDVDMTRLIKMSIKLASTHIEDMEAIKKEEDEGEN